MDLPVSSLEKVNNNSKTGRSNLIWTTPKSMFTVSIGKGKKMSSMSYFQSRSGAVSPPVKTTRTSSLDQQLVRIPFIDVVSNFYHFGITRVTILPFSAPQMSCIFSICETNSDICRIRLDFNVSTEWKDPWWWSSGRQVCLKIGMSWVWLQNFQENLQKPKRALF